ncbi:hypothetical protein MKZ15_23775 [Paenibacillus sp. FSL R7-0216]|uniref:hypothetical protein n=1 Tax=Paenibacillus sp. FSL R7-0216 TaxID=2921677 RepID=UPI0030DCB3C2
MNKLMMKWVLTEQEDAVLYDLASTTACKVKGFREITRNNIKQIRPQVVNELQKGTKAVKLKKELQKHINEMLTEEVVTDLRVKNSEELKGLIDNKKYKLADVLLALITGEAEQVVLAESLFNSTSEQRNLSQYEPQTDSISDLQKEHKIIEKDTRFADTFILELEEQLSKEKDKSCQLEKTLKELREKRKAEIQEWKKERKRFIEEIKTLNTEVENKNKQITEHKDAIDRLRGEVDELQVEIRDLTKQVEMKTTRANKLPAQPVNPTTNKMKVVLLGENINESLLQTPRYAVELVGNNQVEDFLHQESQADEIWMLSFQISPPKQRKLRNAFPNNNIKEFATLVELQAHINKR